MRLAIIFILLSTSNAFSEAISFDDARNTLSALIWVTPNAETSPNGNPNFEKNSLLFQVEKRTPFQKLSILGHPSVTANAVEADQQNALFITNPETFIRFQHTATFRDAQLAFFANRKFDYEKMQYEQTAPYLKSWGGLPYPPIRVLPDRNEKLTAPIFDRSHEAWLDSQTGSNWVKNKSLKLFQNGDAKVGFLNIIQSAKKFLFLNELSLVCDETTEPVIAALESQAKVGVDVRIILNQYFAYLDRSCLDRLKKSGVAIVQVRTHSSYVVNDQNELLIGSESIARMFFSAHGYDFLDRDQMLYVQGGVATDAIRDFLSIWEESRETADRASTEWLAYLRSKQNHELQTHEREGIDANPEGVCRFVSQMPNHGTQEGKIEHLFREMISRSQHDIFMSGVRFDSESPLVALLREKASTLIHVDLLGNGLSGADGELSQYLDEVSERWKNRGEIFSYLSHWLDSIRDWDALRMAKIHAENFEKIAKNTPLQAWAYFHFLHYKIGMFDQSAVWIGSANIESDNFKNAYESGILCIDPSLIREITPILARDLENSLPYRH